jgi:hypothetical protein
VNGFLIAKSDHPYNSAFKFSNGASEPKTIMLLRLNPQGILNYADAPFSFQVRSFSHDLALEVIGKAMVFKDHVNAYHMTFQLLFVSRRGKETGYFLWSPVFLKKER